MFFRLGKNFAPGAFPPNAPHFEGDAKPPTTQRAPPDTAGRYGNLEGRLNLAITMWTPPYSGGLSLYFRILYATNSPSPNAQLGGGEIWNHRPDKEAPRNATETHGTLWNLTERLNLAIPHWNPLNFGEFPPK